TVLEGACYDCHSFQTDWPWYAYVAPAKWLVRDHVAEGRSELNFTAWNRLSLEDRPHKLEEIAEEVEEEHMPLRGYLILHPEARLTDADRELLVEWALAASAAAEHAGDPGEMGSAEEDTDG
ncbi:MAG: heme-binding domain-containing protein, partial [Candidatus Longimicrobiales bacterium M2_2A_002]